VNVNDKLASEILQQLIDVLVYDGKWEWVRRKHNAGILISKHTAKADMHIIVKIVDDKIKLIEMPQGVKLKMISIANPNYLTEFEQFISSLV